MPRYTPPKHVTRLLLSAHVDTWRERLQHVELLRQMRDRITAAAPEWEALMSGIVAVRVEIEQRERRIAAAGGLLFLVAP